MAELYIGLLSGTSIDSIDAAIVEFDQHRCSVAHTCSHPIPPKLHGQLIETTHREEFRVNELAQLDALVGELLADAVLALLASSKYPKEAIRAIGSHGQTIRHRPDLSPSFTWQIGDPTRIVEHTGITTVSDFRRRDIAAGGEGAPLAPLFHHYRFTDEEETRAVVNIGGIANISILPSGPSEAIAGFDCGPGNVLMDGWIQQHRSQPFDQQGAWAASGTVSGELLERLLQIEYLRRPPPKSTGRELFNLEWLEGHLKEMAPLAQEDVQATLLEFTASAIAQALLQTPMAIQRVLVCGGGAHNRALMCCLRAKLDIPVETTEPYGIPPDWVEAATFAWLARRAIHGQASNTPPITGARNPVVLGAIYSA